MQQPNNTSSLLQEADKDGQIKALKEAYRLLKEENKKDAIAFYDWASKLSPVDKISVHGRNGGFGPSNLTTEELYDKFKLLQKNQTEIPHT